MCDHMYGHMHSGSKCTGRCIAGIIIAIVFGALFIWTLIQGFLVQSAGREMAMVFWYYVGALVFLAIAKTAKYWAMHCGCDCNYGEKAKETKETKHPKKK